MKILKNVNSKKFFQSFSIAETLIFQFSVSKKEKTFKQVH